MSGLSRLPQKSVPQHSVHPNLAASGSFVRMLLDPMHLASEKENPTCHPHLLS